MKKSLKFLHVLLAFLIFSSTSSALAQSQFQTQSTVPGFPCYRDITAIYQSMQNLKSSYPNLVKLNQIGSSWDGMPIYALEITNQSINESKPRLVLVSGLRANAFAPLELSLRFAEELLANYGESAEDSWILDYLELDLILLANPDGRLKAELQAEQGLEISWQNNVHNSCPENETGVRLNRNFPYQWRGSVTESCDAAYSGESPGSEAESQAIVNYLIALKAEEERILLLHLDAIENEMLSPFRYNPVAENNYIDELYTLGKKITYNSLVKPYRQNESGYPATYGTLVDFAYGELDIPSLLFTMGSSMAGGHATECWYFDEYLLEANLAALKQALKLSSEPFQRAYGPDLEIESLSYQQNSIIISGGADDYTKWFNGADQYSSVKRIEYSIDLPPWHPQAELYPVTKIEQDSIYRFYARFELEIPTEGLSEGKHRIYFQAWDEESDIAASRPGIVSAIDFRVTAPENISKLYLPIIRK